MNLFDKIRRSVLMLRVSLVVMRNHPKLLIFPALIGICTMFIALFFLAPVILWPTGHSIFQAEHWSALAHKLFTGLPSGSGSNNNQAGNIQLNAQPWLLGYGAAMYLASMVMATFFNVAYSSQVLSALNGGAVSVRAGFNVALGRIKSILVWSLFAGVVGLIIREIEQRLSFVGRIIAGLLGLAWSVASVFVIPVIVREEPTGNPISMLGKSAGAIRRTWGEALTGYVGMRGAGVVVLLGSLVFLGAAVAISIALSSWLIIAIAAAGWLVGILAFSYLANVAERVFLCALYIYATEGVVPEPYDQSLLDGAWKVKKS